MKAYQKEMKSKEKRRDAKWTKFKKIRQEERIGNKCKKKMKGKECNMKGNYCFNCNSDSEGSETRHIIVEGGSYSGESVTPLLIWSKEDDEIWWQICWGMRRYDELWWDLMGGWDMVTCRDKYVHMEHAPMPVKWTKKTKTHSHSLEPGTGNAIHSPPASLYMTTVHGREASATVAVSCRPSTSKYACKSSENGHWPLPSVMAWAGLIFII